MDAREVKQSYDSVPYEGGEFPTTSEENSGQAGGN
jgi:hypothetical protein